LEWAADSGSKVDSTPFLDGVNQVLRVAVASIFFGSQSIFLRQMDK
jgi:hypothetical protein